jgi:DNA-binding FadR family transcriptional regulator
MEKPSRFLANSSTALEQLRGLINQHESTPGIPLPTERELSETLGVGRREVRRALDVLEEEGGSGVNRAKVRLLARQPL